MTASRCTSWISTSTATWLRERSGARRPGTLGIYPRGVGCVRFPAGLSSLLLMEVAASWGVGAAKKTSLWLRPTTRSLMRRHHSMDPGSCSSGARAMPTRRRRHRNSTRSSSPALRRLGRCLCPS
ncbi:hypothetical protein BS78_07G048400 [Paspalum vaginatum]|nr:hypothetical protein BS78_07G048400 [Paspalum vaginatum]